jgi:hypothetical protein
VLWESPCFTEMRSNLRFCPEPVHSPSPVSGADSVGEATEVGADGLLHATNIMTAITKAAMRGNCFLFILMPAL